MSERIPSAVAFQMLQALLDTGEGRETTSSVVAFQMLLVLLLTGDESAATLILQRHFAPLPCPSDRQSWTEVEDATNAYGQFLTELEAVMNAYSILLSHLDVLATAACHPEFLGLRRLLEQNVEEWLEKEKKQNP
jgi:hypothetical protein